MHASKEVIVLVIECQSSLDWRAVFAGSCLESGELVRKTKKKSSFLFCLFRADSFGAGDVGRYFSCKLARADRTARHFAQRQVFSAGPRFGEECFEGHLDAGLLEQADGAVPFSGALHQQRECMPRVS